mmetsp:Transcript_34185/g.59798  ORF Transcript_34185/g.59798 Transcript_34185/m.59798 type:complete len:200 (-) Transcript_34185:280-879(-)
MGLSEETQSALMHGVYVPCSTIHPGLGCELHASHALFRCFFRALRIYSPVHILPLLVFRRKQLLANPQETLKKLIIAIARSSLFVGLFNFNARIGLCYSNGILKGMRPISSVIGSILAAMAINIEDPKRRQELSMYLLPRALETLWNIAEAHGLVKSITHGEVGLFSIAMGLMLMLYATEPRYLKHSYVDIFKRLVGEN